MRYARTTCGAFARNAQFDRSQWKSLVGARIEHPELGRGRVTDFRDPGALDPELSGLRITVEYTAAGQRVRRLLTPKAFRNGSSSWIVEVPVHGQTQGSGLSSTTTRVLAVVKPATASRSVHQALSGRVNTAAAKPTGFVLGDLLGPQLKASLQPRPTVVPKSIPNAVSVVAPEPLKSNVSGRKARESAPRRQVFIPGPAAPASPWPQLPGCRVVPAAQVPSATATGVTTVPARRRLGASGPTVVQAVTAPAKHSPFDVLVFDLDNTLVETNALAKFRGNANVGRVDDEYCGQMKDALEAEDSSQIAIRIPVHALQSLRSSWPTVRFAVLTRGPRAYAKTVLEHCFRDFNWDLIVAREDVRLTKPAPDGVLRVLQELAPCTPERCVLIGDHRSDIEAAYTAGVRCAWWSVGRETLG